MMIDTYVLPHTRRDQTRGTGGRAEGWPHAGRYAFIRRIFGAFRVRLHTGTGKELPLERWAPYKLRQYLELSKEVF